MARKPAILTLLLLLLTTGIIMSQGKSAFSGDPSKYKTELIDFMGPNLNPEQQSNLDLFLLRWDSTAFSNENKGRIIDMSSQLSARLMRPVPQFNEIIKTLNYFIDYNRDAVFFKDWLSGLIDVAFNPHYSNDYIIRYCKNTGLLITENVLSETGSVRWKVKDKVLKFDYDTVFYVEISNATLTCYSQFDSTELYNVTGVYYPEIQQLAGQKGIVTWEKAGFSRKDVYAEITNFTINTAKNNFSFDSARLVHFTYFKEPVLGSLSDQAVSITNKEKADYPRFYTYTKEFRIKDIYPGIDYVGGLDFEGANVKGSGENFSTAEITLSRNDTLFLRINSKEFLFSKTGLNSQEASVSLYLGIDSIYHSNLGFSYVSATKQVNLFRTNNPISKSPYYDSYHSLDMYFEYLSWNMNESKIILSRARGSSLGVAQFESSSFFNSNDFMRLMGLDEYHPLNRLIKFSEWYYSETFPVSEFAKWLNKPDEAVTGLCIDLANKGFLFYDRINNEVTIKQKTKDYIDSYAKRKDYDVLNIISRTNAPIDNAILDLNTYGMTVNGVSNVFLSDSQSVAIYPYNRQLLIGKNRSIQFDGVVEAGLFTIFGHKFSFSYDTFKISLKKIDSIKISIETDKTDMYGNYISRQVDNLIQLGTAELYIDNPDNKSGLKSYRQYPIIDATTYSYIFYDKIPGLENIYKKDDFYFKVDPFNYENIDHYSLEDMNLAGEFFGGNILKPIRQNLIIQENNSLGFNMTIPEEGIEIYEGKARLFESMNISNKGLVGSGTLKYLTSTTKSDEYKFFPDSMITQASTFIVEKDTNGIFPVLNSADVAVKWSIKKDEWMATNSSGKTFDLFQNGTTLDGTIKMTPEKLNGTGIVDMTNSRITSDLFIFTSNTIKADTADYNLKSLTTNGYSFIAENARTDINFDENMAQFRLNTDSSVVKFPEIQYICTMTDFAYNMETRILDMEQKGKSNTPLMSPDKLVRLDFANLDKPTFFSTNSLTDTITFSSLKGTYHLDQEYIEAENINYIHIADALIQPGGGKIIISRRGIIQQLDSATIAVNNKHILHSAKIDIESTKRYSGSAIYDYVDENNEIQQIDFPEITVDTLTTSAKGFIPVSQNFRLNPAFSFTGDVTLSSRNDDLTFTGSAGIVHNCSGITSYNIKFKSKLNRKNIMIPVGEKPRDLNDNPVFSGSYINTDSIHIYPAFLSPQKSWSDVALVNASGYLYYEKAKGRYLITSIEKLIDQNLNGNMIGFDKNYCTLSGEGIINLGTNIEHVKISGAGKVIQSVDSGKVNIESILALDFYFSQEALQMMADEIRMIPSLKAVNLNTELNNKGMKDLLGIKLAQQIKEELNFYGTSRNLPKEFNYTLLLNDVKLYWNESSSSFRSTGKIGIGFIGQQPVNAYVDGFIDIQRRRSGDMIDIYLKANVSTWYYFSYVRGVMMTSSGNSTYNNLITNIKQKDRKDPASSLKSPYSYMISIEDRLKRFLRRMESDDGEEEIVNP